MDSQSTAPQTAAKSPASSAISSSELAVDPAEITTGSRSHIYYRDRLFTYPLSLTNALKHLGPIDVALTGLSYLKAWSNAQLNPEKTTETAEDWLIERFGGHLYRIFFKSYFEKVWGVNAAHLSVECAAQSVLAVCTGAFSLSPQNVVSALPLADLTQQLNPSAPPAVQAAANRLQYRSLIVVPLLIESTDPFPQQLYVHSPKVAVSRIQHYKERNDTTVSSNRVTRLALSYFCDDSAPIWQMSDETLVELAIRELVDLRLTVERSVHRPTPNAVIRRQQAYLVPFADDPLAVVQGYLNRSENFQAVDHTERHQHQEAAYLM